jgi:integrase
VLRYTGLRPPHETERLQWNSVDLQGTNILYVSHNTKTGRREVPLRPEAADCLHAMWTRRKAHAAKSKKPFGADEPVFALETGEAYGDLGNLFNKLVARCEFPRRPDTAFYSPYSLRHTFATFALAEGREYAWLEEVMGTSTKMLKDHYKQGTVEQTQAYLREKGLLRKTMNPGDWKPLDLTSDPRLKGMTVVLRKADE